MIQKFNPIKTDFMRTDIIPAKKIVWSTEGVSHPELLLEQMSTQPITDGCEATRFSTKDGKRAAVVIDFGCEFSGGVQIVTRTGGVKARLRFGESVAEAMTPLGVKGTCNDHASRDFEVFMPWNGTQRYGMTGFRFLCIELEQPDSVIDIVAVQGVFTYRDIPYLGRFQSNDELLNQIFDTSAYTVHLCMQEMLWDGVKRDRMVWIGDLHPEVLTIRSVFGDMQLIDDCLRVPPLRTPHPDWPNHISTYGLWYIMILWDWYLYNGRTEMIEELKDYWKEMLQRFADLVHADGGRVLIEEEFLRGFFFDWPTKTLPESEAAINALISRVMEAGAKLCELVGDDELAKTCLIKKAVVDDNPLPHYNKKQVIAMMWLAGHLSKEETARLLSEGGGHGMSTFMSEYILEAAVQTAGSRAALDMLREYYGGMLQVGATTFWEDFDLDWLREGASIERVMEPDEYDIHGDNGRYCYVGFRHSLCHGWSSGPAAFLLEDILGIKILEPGCKKLKIQPDLGDLEWAEGTYPTPYGIVTISARKVDGQVVLDVQAPSGVEIVRE